MLGRDRPTRSAHRVLQGAVARRIAGAEDEEVERHPKDARKRDCGRQRHAGAALDRARVRERDARETVDGARGDAGALAKVLQAGSDLRRSHVTKRLSVATTLVNYGDDDSLSRVREHGVVDPASPEAQRERIRRIMRTHSLSMRALSKAIGRTPAHVGQIIAGKIKVTQEVAEDFERWKGYSPRWLRRGEGPEFSRDIEPASSSPRSGTVAVSPTAVGTVDDERLLLYIRHRIREMLARGFSLRTVAEQLHLPLENIGALWNGALILPKDREMVMRRLGVLPLQINGWWENEGSVALKTLEHDPDLVRRAGFHDAIKAGASIDALLAVIESGEKRKTSKEWTTLVGHVQAKMVQGIRDAQPSLDRKRHKVKIANPPETDSADEEIERRK